MVHSQITPSHSLIQKKPNDINQTTWKTYTKGSKENHNLGCTHVIKNKASSDNSPELLNVFVCQMFKYV